MQSHRESQLQRKSWLDIAISRPVQACESVNRASDEPQTPQMRSDQPVTTLRRNHPPRIDCVSASVARPVEHSITTAGKLQALKSSLQVPLPSPGLTNSINQHHETTYNPHQTRNHHNVFPHPYITCPAHLILPHNHSLPQHNPHETQCCQGHRKEGRPYRFRYPRQGHRQGQYVNPSPTSLDWTLTLCYS